MTTPLPKFYVILVWDYEEGADEQAVDRAVEKVLSRYDHARLTATAALVASTAALPNPQGELTPILRFLSDEELNRGLLFAVSPPLPAGTVWQGFLNAPWDKINAVSIQAFPPAAAK